MGLVEGFSWFGLLQIIGIDIILSGDNALVDRAGLPLAAAAAAQAGHLAGHGRGGGAAHRLRRGHRLLLMVPLLKLAGSLLLLWIAIKLLIPEGEGGGHGGDGSASGSLWNAVRTIVVADAVMSFDNVDQRRRRGQGQRRPARARHRRSRSR